MSKVCLITGGTRGIGRAISRQLATHGFDVIATFRSENVAANRLVDELSDSRHIHVRQSDLSSDSDIDEVLSFVESNFARLDVLINNAGRVFKPASIREIDRQAFHDTLDTNLVGPAILTQRALPLLARATHPAILNVSSTYGILGDPWVVAYSAAKAGLIQLTRALAKELAPVVRVNAILPGHIDTEMTRAASPEFIAGVIADTPLGRIGAPEEVATLADFLISDSALFITGQTFIIDGGHIL